MAFFIIIRMELTFTCKNEKLLKKVWKYECLYTFYNNANILKTIRSIMYVDVLLSTGTDFCVGHDRTDQP